jgi:hypothetical protein
MGNWQFTFLEEPPNLHIERGGYLLNRDQTQALAPSCFDVLIVLRTQACLLRRRFLTQSEKQPSTPDVLSENGQ